MPHESYDFIVIVIVIGAGSAGAVLANRLSARSSHRVCVIEAGGSDASPLVQIPAGILALYGNPRYDYCYMGVPQRELNGRTVPVNRGRVLGGSSPINSMIYTCVLRPRSVGEIILVGGNTLKIDHRFFTDSHDLETLTEGLKLARSLMSDPAFLPLKGREILPGPQVQTDAEIRDYLRAEALSVYHPVGTCKMGTDPLAVAAPATLRVIGLSGLRVADASIMPTLIAGNTNAPSMMIGDRAATMILAHAG